MQTIRQDFSITWTVDPLAIFPFGQSSSKAFSIYSIKHRQYELIKQKVQQKAGPLFISYRR